MARQVSCPRCGKPTLFTPENKYRPFCSERCKIVDLGNWAEEKYAIPIPASEQPDLDPDSDTEPVTDSETETDSDA